MSTQEIYAEIIQDIPFEIDDEDWAEISDDKRHWWNNINKGIHMVQSKYKISYEYSPVSKKIYFYFRSKNKIYNKLLASLKTYGQTYESKNEADYVIKIKI